MKVNLKSIKNFEKEKITSNKLFGGWDGIIGTGSGEFAGFTYESDTLVDDNKDGKWSAGESMVFHHTTPSLEPGRI